MKFFSFKSRRNDEVLSKGPMKDQVLFYIISYPRSGNTWLVNSLSDYIGALRAEIDSKAYQCDSFDFTNNSKLIFGEPYNSNLPVGVKTHMVRKVFVQKDLPKRKILYLYRDGRDVMISYYFYHFGYQKNNPRIAEKFSAEIFNKFLEDNLSQYVDHIQGWRGADKEKILFIKYEDMKNDYINLLKQTKNFLSCKSLIEEDEVKERNVIKLNKMTAYTEVPKSELFKGDNLSFYRKGEIGDWQNYFTDENKALFKEIAGSLLVDLDYEKDFNW